MNGNKKKISVKERVASLRKKIYMWLMQFAVSKGYRESITYGFGYGELLKAWKVGDVIVGDLIAIQGRIMIFAGMNRNGGPGQCMYASLRMPTPEFIPSSPWERRVWTSFDTLSFPPWSKIGHRTKEEWDKMLADSLNRMLPVVI